MGGSRSAKAAVLRGVGAPFEIAEIEMDPLGPTDVRVRLAASGVCHSDLSVQQGQLPFMFPTVLGHEGAGVVVETGSEVSRVAPGDHVVLTWMPPCRGCYWCLRGQTFLCDKGLAQSLGGAYATIEGGRLVRGLGAATFAEESIVSEGAVVRIPREVPLDLAALVGCALSTGIGAVWRTAEMPAGSTAAVIGCGGVGLAVIQGARLAGASEIVAVDRIAGKEKMARASGATEFVDASARPAVSEAVRELTAGRGADFVFEVVGRSETIRQAFASTRKGGTCVVVGAGSPSDQVSFNAFELFLDAKTLIGCVYGSTDADRDFPQLVELVHRGAIDAEALVSQRIRLEDLNQAFEDMLTGSVARSLVVFD